ncbi:Gfo/Idh/MocA family protein, partial [Streptococcus sobrinus]
YIGTPNHTHYDYAKKALEAGKHVICEKPFTMEAEELVNLRQEADKRELILLEAITNQYLANFQSLKENLAKIGQPKIVTVNYSQYSSRYDAFKKGEIAPA